MSISKTNTKIIHVGIYWPTTFKDIHAFASKYDWCQCTRNISRRDEIPLKNILEVKVLNIWGIGFIGPFPSYLEKNFILITIDYM